MTDAPQDELAVEPPGPGEHPWEDRAWADIPLPLPPAWIRRLFADPWRLLQLNPYYDIKHWESQPDGLIRLELFNTANNHHQSTLLRVESRDNTLSLFYNQGLKATTVFRYQWPQLKLTDYYRDLPEAEKKQRLDEVDRSIAAWGLSIKQHFQWRRRLRWLPWMDLYFDRFWLKMSFGNRRVIWWVTIIMAVDTALLFIFLI